MFSLSHEWNQKHKTFGVQIRAFTQGLQNDEFGWCLYAIIYDNNPLFNNPEFLIEKLYFHGGCTYDEKFTQIPARGLRYDWMKERSYLKIGCDYLHYQDNFDSCNPAHGIPLQIKRDAENLVLQLSELCKVDA